MARQPRLPNAATETGSDAIRIVTNFRDGTVRIAHDGWSTKIACLPSETAGAEPLAAAKAVNNVAEGIQRALTYLLEDVSAKSLGDVVVEHLTQGHTVWVTLYTDASYNHRDHAAGWGIWARSEFGRIVKNGKAPDWIRDGNAAEIYAVVAGLEQIVETWPGVKGVLVNSDSEAVLRAIAGGTIRHGHIRQCAKMMREISKKHGIRLRAKYVRGHGRGKDVRTWLNNAVDRLATRGRTG